MLQKLVEPIVKKLLVEYLTGFLQTLDTSKSYILVLPEGFDQEEVKEQIAPLKGKLNLVVFISDNVRLLEF